MFQYYEYTVVEFSSYCYVHSRPETHFKLYFNEDYRNQGFAKTQPSKSH